MGRIYNVVFQSSVPSTTTVGEVYYYDWAQLPQGEYKVSFSFVSAIATLVDTSVANIYVDLGQNCAYASASNEVYRSGYLGSLKYSGTGSANYLYSAVNDNPPVYLMNRPNNNRIMIEIHSNATGFETNYSPNPGEYTLCLSFELQD